MSIIDEYIDGAFFKKNPSFHIEDSPWKTEQILKGIDRCQLFPKMVIEVGCGAGEVQGQLAQSFPSAEYQGFELSP